MSNEPNTGKRNAPGWFSTPHGRFVYIVDGWQNEFHLRDHFGYNRVVLLEEEGDEYKTLQQNHYYPFGMLIPSLSTTNTLGALKDNRYLYNGKLERSGNPDPSGEFNDDFELNWYVYPDFIGNYGVKFYDAQIARWHSVDPLAEERIWLSPYNYVQNNPIIRIDPDGKIHWRVVGKGALGFAGGVGSLALAATLTPTGIVTPAAGYLAVQGIAGASFGVTTMVIGFASPSSEETRDLANSTPSCLFDLMGIMYQQSNDIESEMPRTVAQSISLMTSFSLSKAPNTASNGVRIATDLITAVQGVNIAVESNNEKANTHSDPQRNNNASGSPQNNNDSVRVSSLPDEKYIGSIPK
ncbi:MAG: hypothetical protein K0B09_05370 [Bacteroidales bacterium]|nr:hypothetical protein [Bacteroidales bacterium]